MFSGDLPTVQDYSFQPTATNAPKLQGQGKNRLTTHAGNSSKQDSKFIRKKVNRLRGNDNYSSACNAMQIVKLFSSKDRKYRGKYDESYDEFVDEYLTASLELCLSPLERLQYLHNLFHGEDLCFHNANVVERARQLSEAQKMMKEQFNSASKQQQVKAELSNLPMANYSEEKVVTIEEHSRNWRTTLKITFRYVPGFGGMRLKRSGSCSMHSLQKTEPRTRCRTLVHLHHGKDYVVNLVTHYRFESNVKANHAGLRGQQPIFHCPEIR